MNGARQGGLACLFFIFNSNPFYFNIKARAVLPTGRVLLGLTETFFRSNCEVSSLSQLVPG